MATRGESKIRLKVTLGPRVDSIDEPGFATAAANVTASTIWSRNVHCGGIRGMSTLEPAPVSRSLRKDPQAPYASISMESPVSAQGDGSAVKTDGRSSREQSPPIALNLGSQFLRMGEDSAFVSDTGAAAILSGFRWSGNRNLRLGGTGAPCIDLSRKCAFLIR